MDSPANASESKLHETSVVKAPRNIDNREKLFVHLGRSYQIMKCKEKWVSIVLHLVLLT